LGKNKKLPQDERGTEVSLLKGKPDKEKTLGKNKKLPQVKRGTKVSLLKAYELLFKDYCTNTDNFDNSDIAGGVPLGT
jgi:hypothetical protein